VAFRGHCFGILLPFNLHSISLSRLPLLLHNPLWVTAYLGLGMQVGLKIGIAVHLAFVFCRQPNEANAFCRNTSRISLAFRSRELGYLRHLFAYLDF